MINMATKCRRINGGLGCGDNGGGLEEVASILAGAILRLLAKHAPAPKKRAISRDNRLEVSRETSPDAVNL